MKFESPIANFSSEIATQGMIYPKRNIATILKLKNNVASTKKLNEAYFAGLKNGVKILTTIPTIKDLHNRLGNDFINTLL